MSNEATGADARSAALDAGPLGYLALGLTLLSYGVLQTGVLSGTSTAHAAGLAHFVGGIALFIAGLWQFRSGDTFGGTAFAGLGAFWLTWAAGVGAGGGGKHAAGLFLLVWTLLALTLAAASWHSGLFSRGVYGLLTISLLLAAIGTFAGSDGLVKAAGWVAAVSGLISWYWATAALTNSGWGRAALPVK
ncbi:succinate-acetate transporter protein [Kitasatospora sp. MAP12-15]|uniref:acetate uptake transporter n=1 Tax=unclassified Kitasatospora TaxID=2633591 RepID=UPI00247571BF|nr:acetate uptake transporter [Kitasatospora sp. MAP12-44]MDH6113048.1 succinate-acetate transporter protein [Kitasatospora sp. MAP12-44]